MKKSYKLRKIIYSLILKHIDLYNRASPFPLWDSYYTDYLRKTIEMNKIEYDKEPVDCCAYCKSIYIVEDEEGNDKCLKCNNIIDEEFERFDNMDNYVKKYGEIWGFKMNINLDEKETS